MPCPTCDHTMQQVYRISTCKLFWCPRCGTLQETQDAGFVTTEPPSLVIRCREFYAEVTKHTRPWHQAVLMPEWHRNGIAESINKPDDRPKPSQ